MQKAQWWNQQARIIEFSCLIFEQLDLDLNSSVKKTFRKNLTVELWASPLNKHCSTTPSR
jgi:hypothetical protein